MNRTEKLEAALALIAEVRMTINGGRHKCECCGLTTYHDMNEWKLEQALEAAAYRVRKVKEELTKLENERKISLDV